MTEVAEALAQESPVIVITSAPGSASKPPLSPGMPELTEFRKLLARQIDAGFACSLPFCLPCGFSVLKHARSEDVLLRRDYAIRAAVMLAPAGPLPR